MYSGRSSACFEVATAMYTPITSPQKRIDPSSDDQRLTIETQVGTDRDPTCATYPTEKSCVRSAYSIVGFPSPRTAATPSASRRVQSHPLALGRFPVAKP